MYDLGIAMRGHRFHRVACDEYEAYNMIRGYLLTWGINILISDDLRDIDAFQRDLEATGAFTGAALDAEITLKRRP